MASFPPRHLALTGALASAAALAVAHGAEIWAELPPCALCLWERWPYRAAAVLGLLAALLPTHARALLWTTILAIVVAAVLGGIHTGVEFGWWPSPLPECSARLPIGGSIADRLAAMPARPAKPCDQPVFLIPGLALSMAAMNLLYALTVSAVLAALVPRRTRKS